MDHSEEYYKMKYFKYKAKYIKEKQAQQSGGSKSKGAAKKNGSSGIFSKIKAGLSLANQKNTDEKEVIQAIKDLNDIYQDIHEKDDKFIEYLKNVKTDTPITDLKKKLNEDFFSDNKMKKYTDKEKITAKTKLKNDSYEKLDKQCTPYIGKDIQQSCIDIFKS